MSSPSTGDANSPVREGITSTEASPTAKRAAKRGDRHIQETINFNPHVQPLRPSHTFTLVIPKRVRECQKGGANLHIPILWDDGLKWLIRIKLHWTVAFGEVQQGVRRMVLESEKETMIRLKRGGLPVPQVYGPVVMSDGIEFIVVECMDGKPCSRPIHKSLEAKPLDRLIHQFAQFQIKLSALTFHSLGSLYSASSQSVAESHSVDGVPPKVEVGPSISLRFVNPDPPYFLGPFTTAGDRYLANIELMLSRIEGGDRSLGHPAVVYLAHLWYRDTVTSMPRLWETEEIMTRHADDQGDHILSDPEGNLCGVIDWEWAVTTTKSDAFTAPMGLVDIPKFQSGSNDLSIPELKLAEAYTKIGRGDLAVCVRGGKVHQRLWSCIGSRPTIGKVKGLVNLAQLNDTAIRIESDLGTGADLAEWCEWVVGRYQENEVLTRLMREDSLSWEERCAIKERVEGDMSSP